MIRDNLIYDPIDKCWTTSYPWLVDPHSLPNNYSAVLSSLKRVEKSLAKDATLADSYAAQMQDLFDRGVARILTPEEMRQWYGPVFYISHLAVLNPKSSSTPLRICFNSSAQYQNVSLNDCLAKGPDSYANDPLGILLRFREYLNALLLDLVKMFDSGIMDTKELE